MEDFVRSCDRTMMPVSIKTAIIIIIIIITIIIIIITSWNPGRSFHIFNITNDSQDLKEFQKDSSKTIEVSGNSMQP